MTTRDYNRDVKNTYTFGALTDNSEASEEEVLPKKFAWRLEVDGLHNVLHGPTPNGIETDVIVESVTLTGDDLTPVRYRPGTQLMSFEVSVFSPAKKLLFSRKEVRADSPMAAALFVWVALDAGMQRQLSSLHQVVYHVREGGVLGYGSSLTFDVHQRTLLEYKEYANKPG